MDARLLDVLHDAADDRALPVADGVHVHFDGVFQELVDEDRVLGEASRAQFMKLTSPASSATISMARPPST